MKMVVNGIEVEVEQLKLVKTIEEPWCRYVARDKAGKLWDVRVRTTATNVKMVPGMKNQDGSQVFHVAHNTVVAVDPSEEKPEDYLTL